MAARWTPEQIRLLRLHYPDKEAKDLVSIIGRTEFAIYTKAENLCIKKSEDFKKQTAARLKGPTPLGYIYEDTHGYLVQKANNDYPLSKRFQYVHIIEWEKHNGPVPAGYILTFKDGNKKNIDIGNLELTTRAKIIEKHSINRYPPELIQTIKLCNKLQRAIKEKEDEDA